jgi:NADPH:quinone reductase-like Zn-dependent oxidoreductase
LAATQLAKVLFKATKVIVTAGKSGHTSLASP